jgi:hypothetical protein
MGSWCWESNIVAVLTALLQLHLHVALQHNVDWCWSSARGVAWCSLHGASASACVHRVRAL